MITIPSLLVLLKPTCTLPPPPQLSLLLFALYVLSRPYTNISFSLRTSLLIFPLGLYVHRPLCLDIKCARALGLNDTQTYTPTGRTDRHIETSHREHVLL